MGTLTKQIYRYTHKRNMRHNENLWPFVKIRRAESGEITDLKYRHQSVSLARLSDMQNQFSGSLLLTATGPSVREIDFSQRPDNITIAGVNGAWKLKDTLKFKLYFIVDMTFIDHHAQIIKEICSSQGITLFTTVMGIIKLIDALGYENIHCKLAIIEDICYETYKPSVKKNQIEHHFSARENIVFSHKYPEIAFSTDICKGVFDAGTVVYWALQVIAHLGFAKIYIAGLDLNNLSAPRFYENESSKRPSYLHDKLNELVFPALQLASEVLAMKGISVINLSPLSSVPESTFPKQGF
ncbi:sugar glycosyltransferase [Enterobacter sp. CC120223-11]|uniref:sugar glycosyltransferase n=1 Tax=Enterobacter sp. CC120223-11 TaxID=1378073 RepID=UPI000BD4CA80|nr:sugar glycosyltransferase [Enterobacter sp. CC120223-11]SNY66884.1 Kdo-III transferase WaaZ [Enterobacter sp. CC120223-11]